MADPIRKIKSLFNPSEFECVYAGPPMEVEPVEPKPNDIDPVLLEGVYAGPVTTETVADMRLVYAAPQFIRQDSPEMACVYAGPMPDFNAQGFMGMDEAMKYPESFASSKSEETPARKVFCEECGTLATTSAKFCLECGAPLPPAEVECLDVYAGPDMMP